MPGQFDPQIIQGSSLRGESFIKPPTQRVPEGLVDNALDVGVKAYGAHVVRKAQENITSAQSTFLDDLSSARNDIAQAEEIRQDELASPVEKAAYDKYTGQVKSLNAAVASRRLNPAEAQARIETIKRKAISQAPFFASRIKALTGDRGRVFDAETDQLIKETNDRRDEAVSRGLNPDNPAHMEMLTRHQLKDQEAKFIASNKEVYGHKTAEITRDIIDNQIESMEAVISSSVDQFGGIENLPEAARAELLEMTQGFKNGREAVVVRQLIDANPNLDYSDLSPEIVARLEAQVRGSAEASEKVLSGAIPQQVAQTQLSLAKDREFLRLKAEAPDTFSSYALFSAVPPGSVASSALGEVLAKGMLDYTKLRRSGDPSTKGMEDAGYTGKEIREIKNANATNLKTSLQWLKNNPESSTDPKFVNSHYQVLTKDLDKIANNPQGFTPDEHDGYLDYIGSTEMLDRLGKIDANTLQEFKDKSARYIRQYANEHLGADIRSQMNKPVFTDTFSSKGKTASAKDLVSVNVNANGTLQFSPKSGLISLSDEQNAINLATKFNSLYKRPSMKLVRASKNAGEIGDGVEREIMLSLLQGTMSDIGAPFSEGSGEVQVPEGGVSPSEITPVLSRDR